jgi:hypothetical protein
MTVLTRSARSRRSGRRPGWLLLTVLLVLAIMASSALVFTDRAELLKLAVILALWAAVVAAFVSVIYRRQSDIDQARARDLKLVYDLQLDREISARREYELTVESELRRELASELRAQSADEVAALRAELAALRANLEILFDADLSHRPAIETERTAGRVSSSRIDAGESDYRTDESPIIDVSAVPHAPEHERIPTPLFGGAHRRESEAEPTPEERLLWAVEQRAAEQRAAEQRAAEQRAAEQRAAEQRIAEQLAERRAAEQRAAEQRAAQQRAVEQLVAERQAAEQRAAEQRAAEQLAAEQRRAWEPPTASPQQQPEPVTNNAESTEWNPAPAEGHWIPAGMPGSNWASPVAENGSSGEYVGKRRAPEPAMSTPPGDPRRGRHSAPPDAVDPGRPSETARHRGADESDDRDQQHTGGQSVAELLARLDAGSSGGGGRRRRREE